MGVVVTQNFYKNGHENPYEKYISTQKLFTKWNMSLYTAITKYIMYRVHSTVLSDLVFFSERTIFLLLSRIIERDCSASMLQVLCSTWGRCKGDGWIMVYTQN